MDIFKTGLVIIAAALAACAGGAALKTPDGTAYYYGQVLFFSPDGKLPYGRTESAVKREISGSGARIVETVTRPGASHSMRAMETVTELARREKTLVYDASDAERSFSGTVTFKDATLSAWTYDLKLKAGGAITGSGSLSPEGIATKKQLSGTERPMAIKEDLKTIPEGEYAMRVEELRPPAGAE